MNSFLDLHSSADYRNTNRPYYTGTWEYIHVGTDRLIPFQFVASGSDLTITRIESDGSESVNTTSFHAAFGKVTSWTHTGTGGHSSSGSQLLTWTPDPGDYWTSNNFSCTAGESLRLSLDPDEFENSALVAAQVRKGAVSVASMTMASDGVLYYTIPTTGTDYNIVIICTTTGIEMVSSNYPSARISTIYNSGNYWWYNGGALSSSPANADPIFRIKIVCGASTFYSDWMEADVFTGKTKITLSSSYDYGGIKYTGGYTQWMYKDATVRRSPRAEIEVTGDRLNGAIIEEKKVSAIRYKLTMKCTESEYEGLVHAMGGTLTITDDTGRVYNAVNVEMSDPTWFRGNGVVELSFVDSNNINIWTYNNSSL